MIQPSLSRARRNQHVPLFLKRRVSFNLALTFVGFVPGLYDYTAFEPKSDLTLIVFLGHNESRVHTPLPSPTSTMESREIVPGM